MSALNRCYIKVFHTFANLAYRFHALNKLFDNDKREIKPLLYVLVMLIPLSSLCKLLRGKQVHYFIL